MVQGQSSQPKDLSSHQAGVFPRTQWELQLSIHPVNRTTVWTVDSKEDHCPSTTLPNKVLKTVPSAQGPEKIHTTRAILVTRVPTAPGLKPTNSLITVQPSMTVIPEVILPAKEKEKIFTCWSQSVNTGRGVCSFKCTGNARLQDQKNQANMTEMIKGTKGNE